MDIFDKIDFSKIYSPSRLVMFELCPKQYQFYYLDPIYSKMKNELKRHPQNIFSFYTLGKAVHNAITLFYHLPIEQRTEVELKNFLKETWRSEVMWQKKPPLLEWGGFENVETEREAYLEALAMLRNFFRMYEKEVEIEYLPIQDLERSIEDYKKLIRPLTKEFNISGKFDLVVRDGQSLRVIDFKTGKKDEADQFQLRFYKVLAEENFQKPVKSASFYFLRSGAKKDFNLGSDHTEEIKKEIVDKIETIQKCQNFTTNPGKLCKFCLFKTFCPDKVQVKGIIKDIKEDDYADDLPF